MANCGIGIGEGAPNWELQKMKDESKSLVYTRRRGYEITRNPHLNKVKGWAAESAGLRAAAGEQVPCVAASVPVTLNENALCLGKEICLNLSL